MPHRSFYLHFRLPEIIYLPPSENIPLSYDITGVFRPCLLRLLCIGQHGTFKNSCTSCSLDLKQPIKPQRWAINSHKYSSIFLLTQLCMLSRPLQLQNGFKKVVEVIHVVRRHIALKRHNNFDSEIYASTVFSDISVQSFQSIKIKKYKNKRLKKKLNLR